MSCLISPIFSLDSGDSYRSTCFYCISILLVCPLPLSKTGQIIVNRYRFLYAAFRCSFLRISGCRVSQFVVQFTWRQCSRSSSSSLVLYHSYTRDWTGGSLLCQSCIFKNACRGLGLVGGRCSSVVKTALVLLLVSSLKTGNPLAGKMQPTTVLPA